VKHGRIPAALVTVALAVTSSCGSDTERFCDRLRESATLLDLRNALDRDDRAAVQAALNDFSDLADDAPEDIRPDLQQIARTVTSTVRAVTNVTAPDGSSMPVDVARLNEELGKVAPSSQRIAEFADRDCGITLPG
jgi:hypothetical protein